MSHALMDPADFKSSVVAVPPIAMTADQRVDVDANRALLRHVEKGGVSIILYGGNANLYHFDLARYFEALTMMTSVASPATRIITSIGPDFGKAMDQARMVEHAGLKNVMLLPVGFPSDSHGVGLGVQRIAERLGHGVILYIKRDGYVSPGKLAYLVKQGAIRFVKYAVERPDPANDPYLDSLLSEIGPDLIASGMGEGPIADHLGRRGMATFTSGAVCIAPAAAMQLLSLHRAGRREEARALCLPFLAFERVRTKLGSVQVLHDAVSAQVAEMGPLLPMVSNVRPSFLDEVRAAAGELSKAEAAVVAGRPSVTADTSRAAGA